MMPKKNNKVLLQEWEAYCKHIQNLQDTYIAPERPAEKQQRIKALLADYEAFVQYYFPSITGGVASAPFHIQAAKTIKQNNRLKAVFEWARDHAKSTHLSLFVPLWLKPQGLFKSMLLVSNNETDAVRILSKIQAHLAKNTRYIADFGEQSLLGDWTTGEFTSADGTYFRAIGKGQSPRGTSSAENVRPDLIIIDDFDNDEEVRNPKRIKNGVKWIKEALFNAMDMGKGRFVMVGNRIHKHSALAQIAASKNIHHHVVNALDKDGNPSWPSKYSLKELQDVFEFVGYISTQKEYFNNPIEEGTIFKPEYIAYTKLPALNEFEAICTYFDPSWKSSSKADFKAIVTVGSHKTKLYIIDIFLRQTAMHHATAYMYDLCRYLPETAYFFMESNFMQDELLNEFYEQGLKEGFQLPISGDYRKKPDKLARIENLVPLFERKLLMFDQNIKDRPDTELAIDHLLAVEKGSRTPDDFPDALEGAIYKIRREIVTQDTENLFRVGKRSVKYSY
jgi:hypothetical protein